MQDSYSEKPTYVKLGVSDNLNVDIINAPEDYSTLIGLPARSVVLAPPEAQNLDFIHLFIKEAEKLPERLLKFRQRITPSGVIWVSWPKKASRVPTDVTEDVIRAAALASGLVDIKVCSINAIWSGLKLVIPKAMRHSITK